MTTINVTNGAYHVVKLEGAKKQPEQDGPHAIAPTDKERQAGVYSPRNLQRVLGALHQDGLVVLKDVIDKGHIDSLNAVMTADAEKRIADPKQEFNHNVKCEFFPPGGFVYSIGLCILHSPAQYHHIVGLWGLTIAQRISCKDHQSLIRSNFMKMSTSIPSLYKSPMRKLNPHEDRWIRKKENHLN